MSHTKLPPDILEQLLGPLRQLVDREVEKKIADGELVTKEALVQIDAQRTEVFAKITSMGNAFAAAIEATQEYFERSKLPLEAADAYVLDPNVYTRLNEARLASPEQFRVLLEDCIRDEIRRMSIPA